MALSQVVRSTLWESFPGLPETSGALLPASALPLLYHYKEIRERGLASPQRVSGPWDHTLRTTGPQLGAASQMWPLLSDRSRAHTWDLLEGIILALEKVHTLLPLKINRN